MDVASTKLHHRHVWILAYPAEDVPGEWIAHCLDVDVVMQGPTVDAALQSAIDGALFVMKSDLSRGEDPFARRAPESDWSDLLRVTSEGERFASDRISEKAPDMKKLAVQCDVFLDVDLHGAVAPIARDSAVPAPAWRVAAAPAA